MSKVWKKLWAVTDGHGNFMKLVWATTAREALRIAKGEREADGSPVEPAPDGQSVYDFSPIVRVARGSGIDGAEGCYQ